jgi:hypothetical protein
VPEDMDELQKKFEEYGDGESFEDFIDGWSGAKKNEEGIYGRITNPRSKWDWWVIGGRWSGSFTLKPDAKGRNGEGGAFSPANTDEGKADVALAGDIDWDAMRQTEMDRASQRYDRWHSLPDKEVVGEELWRKSLFDNNFIFLEQNEVNDLNDLSKEQYVAKYGSFDALTYAFIDLEGKWHGRGEMGWFGMSSDEQPDYNVEWWKFVESLAPDQPLYVVDCHI